jgi:hypothetical protein
MHANVFGYAMSHYNRDSQAIYTNLKITIYGLREERTFKGYRVACVGERSERRANLAGRYWWVCARVGQRERGAFEWEGRCVEQKRWTTRPVDNRDSMALREGSSYPHINQWSEL